MTSSRTSRTKIATTRGWARHRLAALLTIAIAIPLLAACPNPGSPGDPIGQIIDQLGSEVSSVIDKAGQTAQGLLLAAASAVQQTIDGAASAFGDQLTKGINQVDAAVKTDLDSLQQLVTNLGSTVTDVVSKTADQAAALLVQIGVGANVPLVKSYSPRLTTAANAANGLPLHLHGVFPRTDQPGYAPTLTVNHVQQPAGALKSNTLTDLTFVLPPQTFADGVPGISSPDIEVHIPFAKGVVFHKVVPGVFHVEIATVPDEPVKSISLTKTTPGTTTVVPHLFQTEDVYLSSLDCHTHSYDVTLTPRSGWRFDPDSIKPVILPGYPKGPSGNWEGPTVTSRGPSSAQLHAKTTPGTCVWPVFEGGRTFFHFTYTELEPVTSAPTATVTPLTLNWGDQLSADVPQSPGTWHLDVTLWNGVRLTAPPTQTNRYVSVRDLGTKVAYSAADLSSLTLNDLSPTA